MNILYIEDKRRPERNAEYKKVISRLGYDQVITYCDTTDPKIIAEFSVDGAICHSGMEGYNIITYFSKVNDWPLLSYSGSVDSTPYLRVGKNKRLFSVDSDYFESVLPEFIEHCRLIRKTTNHEQRISTK
ncbi:hypothetical protein CWN81_14580 [Vibrio splendidus]|nr:hypothetical protein CWN81_14580 [Vibrio splendidus]